VSAFLKKPCSIYLLGAKLYVVYPYDETLRMVGGSIFGQFLVELRFFGSDSTMQAFFLLHNNPKTQTTGHSTPYLKFGVSPYPKFEACLSLLPCLVHVHTISPITKGHMVPGLMVTSSMIYIL
jgi:hypothetical protein